MLLRLGLVALSFGFVAGPVWATSDSIPVTVQRLDELAIYREFSAPATVLSLNDSRVSSELRARIIEIPREVGDTVARNGVLVKLDCRDYELESQRLEAECKRLNVRIALARKQLKRAESLIGSSNVSEELVNQREAELDGALAEREVVLIQLATAQTTAAKCVIRAPFDGVVRERLVHVGELADVGTPLLRIVDTQDLEISARVLTADIELLQQLEAIDFEHRGQRYPASIRTVVPVINTLSRNQEVRLQFRNQAPAPGAAGRLLWRDPVLYLPAEFVVRRQDSLGVFIVEDQHARFHPLPQAQEGRPAQANLPADARIITDGRYLLEDGVAIQ